MYQISRLITQSISILFRVRVATLTLIIMLISSTSASNPLSLNGYELVDVYVNGDTSNASLLNTSDNTLTVLAQGDSIVGCTLDYVQTMQASFYCGNEIFTLAVTNASYQEPQKQNSWGGPIEVRGMTKFEYFDYPENFITDFNLVPKVKAGRVVGYRVKKVSNKKVAEELDLQEDDLIVQVNGNYASEPVQFADAVESFATTSTVEMEVVRDDETIYNTYMLEQEVVATCY